MSRPQLKLFTAPCVTRRVGIRLFAQFFGRFTHLLHSKFCVAAARIDNEDSYYAALAELLLKPNDLPDSLIQALHDIEATAEALHRPETIPQGDPASNPENSASDRLRRAIGLYLAGSNQNGNGLASSERREDGLTSSNGQPHVAAKQAGPAAQPLVPPKSDGAGSTLNSQLSTSPDTPHSEPPASAAPSIQQSSNPLIQHSDADPDAAAFQRLARLSPTGYDRVRRDEAKRLHLRVQTLDAEVERRRSQFDDANAHAIQLPTLEPWPEPVLNLAEVLDHVAHRYTLHIVLPSGAADLLSLFTGHCHGPNAARQSPRLNLFSLEGGCGKTTTIEVMATMVPRPLRAENMSPAVLFRVVGQQPPPTLLLDELDTWLAKDPELRGLLNSGHKPGSHAYRCEGRAHAIRAFKAYAPAVLAGLGSLPPTLRDRSILIPLTQAQQGQPHVSFDSNKTELENTLGRKLARWVRDNFAALQACNPVLPPGAFNRLADNWRPLFAIAHLAGSNWPQRAAAAFASLTVKPPSDHDRSLTLLSDIRQIFAQARTDRLFSTTIVACLRDFSDRPWSGADNGDKPITEARLAWRLKTFDIRSKTIRIGDRRAKGYDLADFPPSKP